MSTDNKRYLIFECGLSNLYGRTDTAIVYDTATPEEKIVKWKKQNPVDPYSNPAIVRTFKLDTKNDEEMYKNWMKEHKGEFSWL